jgi:hypothetical protein
MSLTEDQLATLEALHTDLQIVVDDLETFIESLVNNGSEQLELPLGEEKNNDDMEGD